MERPTQPTQSLLFFEEAYASKEAWALRRVCDLLDRHLSSEWMDAASDELKVTYPEISFEEDFGYANFWNETPALLNELSTNAMHKLVRAFRDNGYTVELYFDDYCVKTLKISW